MDLDTIYRDLEEIKKVVTELKARNMTMIYLWSMIKYLSEVMVS
jgi:hypothetical protein